MGKWTDAAKKRKIKLDAQQEKEIGRRSGARPDETENPGA